MARTARKTTVAAPKARKVSTRAKATPAVVAAPAPVVEVEAPADRRGSVVKLSYKKKYAERGHANTCGDWLALQLGEAFPSPLDVRAFEAMLDANGVRHAHWKKTNPGLLRMSGRMALAAKVAAAGKLVIPGHKPVRVPENFASKHIS